MGLTKTILRRTAIGCVPVAALVLMTPLRPAHAQSGGMLGFLLDTVNGIGVSIASNNSSQTSSENLQENTVYPVSDSTNIQSNGHTIIGSYRGWMTSVFSAADNSAQTPSAQALETRMLGGIGGSGSGASPQFSTQYTSTYGSLPTSQQVPIMTQQQIDLNDATAQDAMGIAVLADSNATDTIQTGHSIEDQAMTASAGNAPLLEANALAYELQSMATEHKLYASELRTLGAELANQGANYKQGAINSTKASGAIFNLKEVQ
jgi:hypothetical protein